MSSWHLFDQKSFLFVSGMSNKRKQLTTITFCATFPCTDCLPGTANDPVIFHVSSLLRALKNRIQQCLYLATVQCIVIWQCVCIKLTGHFSDTHCSHPTFNFNPKLNTWFNTPEFFFLITMLSFTHFQLLYIFFANYLSFSSLVISMSSYNLFYSCYNLVLFFFYLTVTSWCVCKLTLSWKMCIINIRVTSVKTRSNRITKNCKTERTSWRLTL